MSNPARDASDAIAGYVYQVYRTISEWLNLQPNELLELERGEDLDVVRVSQDHLEDLRMLQQIKATNASLTLRSPNALTAIANFCEHRRLNATHALKFRYITTSPVGREKGWRSQDTGIELWESIRCGELGGEDETKAVLEIRKFLQQCEKPKNIKADAWNFLLEVVTDQNLTRFQEIVQSFEWSLRPGDALALGGQIQEALVKSGFAADAARAESVFQRLFFYVFKRLTEPGVKQLTTRELEEQLKLPVLAEDDQSFVFTIQLATRVARLEQHAVEGRSMWGALSQQVQTIAGAHGPEFEYRPAQVSLDVPSLVMPVTNRDSTVNRIASQVPGTGWVNVVGEPGSGKTQLCLLFINKVGSRPVWISLRGLTEDRACAAIDDAVETASGVHRHAIVQQWYSEAAKRLNPETILVLDDLPRLIVGGRLYDRVRFLRFAFQGSGHSILSTSYFELPQSLVQGHVVSEIRAPLFTTDEILDLLKANSAPVAIASKIANFLMTATQGLAALVTATIRFLRSKGWMFEPEVMDSLLKGEYADGPKRDARQIIEATVTDPSTRELLYRLACVIGPISRHQIEIIGKVPAKLTLTLEKLDQLRGIWVQPYGDETFRLSPLIDSTVASLLDSNTRKGVHAALAILALRKPLTMVDVMTCVLHFHSAELVQPAVIILLECLVKLLNFPTEVPGEWMVSSLWANQSLPDTVDMSLRLNLRAIQIVLAEMRRKDHRFLTEEFAHLLSVAQSDPGAQLGVLMASGLLATQIYRRSPTAANEYVLIALRSASTAVLPNGKRFTIPKGMSLEWILWGTGSASKSEDEMRNWLDTLSVLEPKQIRVMDDSDGSEDHAAAVCDSVWLREYQKPENDRHWDSVEKIVDAIRMRASEIGLTILCAAAIRTQIMFLAEWRNQVDEAVSLAWASLKRFRKDRPKFLIEEVTGRQLARADRWQEALRWIATALGRRTKNSSLWRRNLLFDFSGNGSGSRSAVSYSFEAQFTLVSD